MSEYETVREKSKDQREWSINRGERMKKKKEGETGEKIEAEKEKKLKEKRERRWWEKEKCRRERKREGERVKEREKIKRTELLPKFQIFLILRLHSYPHYLHLPALGRKCEGCPSSSPPPRAAVVFHPDALGCGLAWSVRGERWQRWREKMWSSGKIDKKKSEKVNKERT